MGEGSLFVVSDDVILMSEWESVLAHAEKFNGNNKQLAMFFTFKGKINNQTKEGIATVAMSPEDAFEMASHILDTLNKFLER